MLSQRQLIKIYTKTIREGDGTFENIFAAQFSQKENIMLEFDEGVQMRKLTFGEVEKMIFSLAYKLEQVVDGRDNWIAINMDNSYQWIVCFWGILASGNKPYLLNLRHPQELTRSILKTLGVKYSLDLDKENSFGVNSLAVNQFLGEAVPEGHRFQWANEIALSTSATTLQEKICIYTGREILAQLSNTEKILKETKGIRKTYNGTIKILGFLPFYHIFGLIVTYFWFVYFGYEIVLLKDYAADTILKTIRRYGVTHIFAVPLFWHSIEDTIKKEVAKKGEKTVTKFNKAIDLSCSLPQSLSFAFAKKALKEVRNSLFGDSVKFCVSGGSYLRPSAQKMLNGLGYPLFNGYGTSEVGITSCDLSKSIKERNKGSVGRHFSSVEYSIKDGCLVISGASTCKSIIVNGVKTDTNGEFNTLDLARIDEKGFCYIEGRQSDLIISASGENVNPDTLEQHFDFSSMAVDGFSILGLNKTDEKITMVIRLTKGASKEEIETIKQYVYDVNATLPSPGNITDIFLTLDPIQAPGAIKVSRDYLKRCIDNGSIKLMEFDKALSDEESFEQGSIEATLQEIFAKYLPVEQGKIGLTSHFVFDLGGGSLEYYSIMVEINDRYHINLQYNPDHPLYTIADFASSIREELSK